MRIASLVAAMILFISTHMCTAQMRIVTDIPPVGSLVSMVGGDSVKVAVLLDGEASPHHFALRPSHARALDQADAIFWVGKGLTPWLDGALQTLGADAEKVELGSSAGNLALVVRDTDVEDDGADVEFDPHMWMDPTIAQAWISEIEQTLREIDPAQAEVFAVHAIAARQVLTQALANAKQELVDFQGFGFVATHDGLQYFENAFGLEAILTLRPSDNAQTGPQQLRAFQQLLDSNTVACLITEPQARDDAAIRMAIEAGLAIQPIDVLGTGLEPGPKLYVELIEAAAQSVRNCRNH